MDIFRQSEDEILFALIDRDNPDINPKLTPRNCYISAAIPNTDDDSGQYNSIAYVVPRYDSGLVRRCAIKYNRIDLEELFRGMSPVSVQGFSQSESFATAQEIAVFMGQTYGLPIREGDVHPSSSAAFYPAPHAEHGRGVYKIDKNKCFIGQVYVAFSRDFTENLANILKPNFLNVLKSLPNVNPVTNHEDWPSPWGFFGDFDFTEIAGSVNHASDISLAQATTIGQHVGRTFFEPVGAYDPARDYDHTNPFGWIGAWNKHVALGKTSALVGQYSWIRTHYSHVKITKMAKDPSTGLAPDKDYFFALYFNWHDAQP